MISISTYRHSLSNNSIVLTVMLKSKDIDIIIGKNLKRLRKQNKLTQAKLGDLINIDGNVIAQLEGAIIGMGKDIMTRLCNALNIEPYEFYIKDDTPLPVTNLQHKALQMAKEAEKAKLQQIAEENIEYTSHRIKTLKKSEGKSDKPRRNIKTKANSQ